MPTASLQRKKPQSATSSIAFPSLVQRGILSRTGLSCLCLHPASRAAHGRVRSRSPCDVLHRPNAPIANARAEHRSALGGGAMADHESSVINKLDARLILSLHGARAGRPAGDPISASVIFTGDLDPLRRCGFQAPSFVHHPDPRREHRRRAGLRSTVCWISRRSRASFASSRRASLTPEMDESVPEIGAKALHEGVGFIPSIKGENDRHRRDRHGLRNHAQELSQGGRIDADHRAVGSDDRSAAAATTGRSAARSAGLPARARRDVSAAPVQLRRRVRRETGSTARSD